MDQGLMFKEKRTERLHPGELLELVEQVADCLSLVRDTVLRKKKVIVCDCDLLDMMCPDSPS
ncbi:uncharacterized protein ASPGLDRAFT_48902 [Aspergillus glaucus CBS 516.65]|uniref:Uncharacterized protein n=1 Tax=Aspergillus glaucus CBS 516.65 TaxID=1160497 RepID=A0A1L9VFX7_ASPGL|nr:hypothetical protein ASPGLDRAFT_48902 [Aspergillus glaucus CBS 516.65]OJJ82794.1 hypothetical protein ASPGLDRAFT_48902 [Aspergillus glaucus CBS 516.65]